jgi:hypothetical protein
MRRWFFEKGDDREMMRKGRYGVGEGRDSESKSLV